MLVVRLLLTVLLAIGSTPFRVCDCAASEASHSLGANADFGQNVNAAHDDGEDDHSHPADHEADCSMLQRAAEMSATVAPAPVGDFAAEPTPFAFALTDFFGHRLPAANRSNMPPAASPLYISLCNLRN